MNILLTKKYMAHILNVNYGVKFSGRNALFFNTSTFTEQTETVSAVLDWNFTNNVATSMKLISRALVDKTFYRNFVGFFAAWRSERVSERLIGKSECNRNNIGLQCKMF